MAKKVELYEKVCRQCGKVFKTDNEREKICLSCKLHNKRVDNQRRASQHKKPKVKRNFLAEAIPIREFTGIIERYNQRHGTRYSYGQFQQKVTDGTIDILEEIKNERAFIQKE